MLQNYLKIAFRNLIKNKLDSTISIGGLALGLACCILLVFYVRFEWSHDNFHKNASQTFRITYQSTNPNSGEVFKSLHTPYPLGAALDSTFPEVERVINIAMNQIHVERKGKFAPRIATFADPGFFQAFTFPLLYGTAETALANPGNVVLTEEAAEYYFGEKQVIGETITVRLHENLYTLTVSAVARSVPANSSIQFDLVLPFENYFRNADPNRRKTMRESWWIRFGETWLILREGTAPEELEAKFSALLRTHFGDMAESRKMKYGLQPLEGAYFNQEYRSGITGNTNRLYSTILGGIALVILAIAGMNFMSLTLSRAYRRNHEMGIRKAAGAQARQISFQLFGEVLVTCSLAFVLGMMLAEIAAPDFQQITGKSFQVEVINDPILWLLLAGMVLLVTLITGIYPAGRISRKKASLLFSSQHTAERIPLFVKGLIVTQFTLAIAFLIATLTMNHQLSYLLNKDLGFSSSNVISVELNLEGDKGSQIAELYSREARKLPGIQQVSVVGGAYRSDPMYIQHKAGIGMGTMKSGTTVEGFKDGITSEIVDEHYIETLDIELLKGRNFSPDRPAELENAIIVNETFVETMGWENPIGQIIEDKAEWGAPFDGKKVIGVISDYHFRPLYEKLQPIALEHITTRDYGPPGTILVKTASGTLSESINRLSALWSKIVPEEIFSYNFLDEMVALQYQEEQRWKKIIQFSSFVAVALACFGLFGLAALAAQRRTKEIGIRKVVGATVSNIVTLLSKDFLKLVLLGFVIAVPIAWYAIHRWLADFAYRIEIGVGIFLLAGGAAVLIALATVSWQSVRAALMNPVDSLRNE